MPNPNLSSEKKVSIFQDEMAEISACNAFLLPLLEQKVKSLVLGATARYFGSSGLVGIISLEHKYTILWTGGTFSMVGGRFCWATITENKLFAEMCRNSPKMCRKFYNQNL